MKLAKYAVALTLVATSAVVVSTALNSAGSTSVRPCTGAQLTLSHGAPQGTAGTTFVPLVITNHGRTCTIEGVPAVRAVLGSPAHPLGPFARNLSMGEMPALHVLNKGKSVSSALGVVESGNYPPATCLARDASGVEVTLARFFTARYLRMPISVCTKRASLTTQLIVVGSTGF